LTLLLSWKQGNKICLDRILTVYLGARTSYGTVSPPRGRSGGVLWGINSTALDLSLIVEGEFFIKFHLRNKNDDFKWILMAVYGPAQDDFKSAFLSELVRTCQQNPWPTLIGGGGF